MPKGEESFIEIFCLNVVNFLETGLLVWGDNNGIMFVRQRKCNT